MFGKTPHLALRPPRCKTKIPKLAPSSVRAAVHKLMRRIEEAVTMTTKRHVKAERQVSLEDWQQCCAECRDVRDLATSARGLGVVGGGVSWGGLRREGKELPRAQILDYM